MVFYNLPVSPTSGMLTVPNQHSEQCRSPQVIYVEHMSFKL